MVLDIMVLTRSYRGNTVNADINAALNIALKGQEKVNKYYLLDKASVINILKGSV